MLAADSITESSDMLTAIANSENSSGESTIAGMVIICPTNLDRQIIAESGVISLPRGDTITVEVNNYERLEHML